MLLVEILFKAISFIQYQVALDIFDLYDVCDCDISYHLTLAF